MKQILRSKKLDYEIDDQGQLLEAPGACGECTNGQRSKLDSRTYGVGHHLCQQVPDDLLELGRVGAISCHFDNAWNWYWNFL